MLKIKRLGFIFFFVSTMWASMVVAADQMAVVVNEPAFIYKSPDFDSDQIGQISLGQKLKVSKKKTGPFYKTKLKQGVSGWVSDADIQLLNSKGKMVDQSGPFKKTDENNSSGAETPKSGRKGPFWNSFMVGFSGGMVRYAEVIGKIDYKEDMSYYGLKITAPFRLLDGPFFIDLSGHYHSGTPSYYASISETKPTGYFLISELSVLMQLADFWGREGAVYLGAGPMINYSRFFIYQNGAKQDLEEVRIGMTTVVGAAFSFGQIVLKLEGHYYLERANFMGGTASLQFAF